MDTAKNDELPNEKHDELAESLNDLFSSICTMIKSELQGTNNHLELLEKMNVRVAEEYKGFGDVASGLRVFVEQLKCKSGSFNEYVEQIDAIEKQVTEFEAVVSMLDKYVSLLESKVQSNSGKKKKRGDRKLTAAEWWSPMPIPSIRKWPLRRRIVSIFNKHEDDFPSLREYSDYLEEVEDMTFNLIEGIDVAGIEAKIAKYQEENAQQIMGNRAQKAEESAAALAASKGQPAQNDTDVAANQGSKSGFGAVPQGQYAPTFPGQPRPTGMASDMLGYAGDDDEETMRLLAERGARAGGWSAEISRKRAIEVTFGSMCVY